MANPSKIDFCDNKLIKIANVMIELSVLSLLMKYLLEDTTLQVLSPRSIEQNSTFLP